MGACLDLVITRHGSSREMCERLDEARRENDEDDDSQRGEEEGRRGRDGTARDEMRKQVLKVRNRVHDEGTNQDLGVCFAIRWELRSCSRDDRLSLDVTLPKSSRSGSGFK